MGSEMCIRDRHIPHQTTSLKVLKASAKFAVNVIIERCKECGLCINACPQGVLAKGSDYNSRGYRFTVPKFIDKCVGCRLCEYVCPDFAIYVVRGE